MRIGGPKESLERGMQPRGRKRELRGDVRQRELLEALAELLSEGYSLASLSVEDIAKRAGISRPAFYFYFESKEDALMAALVDVREKMLEGSRAFFEGGQRPPFEELQDAIRAVIRLWRANQPILRAFIEAAATNKDVWAYFEEFVEAFVQPIAARIEKIRTEQNRPVSEAESVQLARALLWGNERNFYRASVEEFDENEWDQLVRTLSLIWTGALLGPLPEKTG